MYDQSCAREYSIFVWKRDSIIIYYTYSYFGYNRNYVMEENNKQSLRADSHTPCEHQSWCKLNHHDCFWMVFIWRFLCIVSLKSKKKRRERKIEPRLKMICVSRWLGLHKKKWHNGATHTAHTHTAIYNRCQS